MRSAKIVVGTDGSRSSRTAMRWAARTAERGGNPLEILVAYHWQAPGRWQGDVRERRAAAEEQAGAIGTAAADEARTIAPHVALSISLRAGDAAPVLLTAAEDA